MKKAKPKSKGVPLDEIRVERMKDPKRAKLATEVAVEEFEKDNDVIALLHTLRLGGSSARRGSETVRRISVAKHRT